VRSAPPLEAPESAFDEAVGRNASVSGRALGRRAAGSWFSLGACDMAARMRIFPAGKARAGFAPLVLAGVAALEACSVQPAAEPATAAAVPAAPEQTATASPAQPKLVADPSALAARAIIEAPDRTPEDREADARRQPEQLLQFIGVTPGERVADLGAGSGYTTELLARSVGPAGTVYAQNDKLTVDKFVREAWPARLAREANRNVVRMDREFDAPFSAAARELDLVTLLFAYHDAVAHHVDRGKLNAAVFQALKPGGRYVVADHRAAPGSGLEAASALHRIDEKIVRDEIEAAGFEFVESADFMRDSSDDASEPSFQRGFRTDRFILKFVKPAAS
jgi:predicted methyltransferase